MVFVALLAEAGAAVLVAGALAAWSRHHFTPRTTAEGADVTETMEPAAR